MTFSLILSLGLLGFKTKSMQFNPERAELASFRRQCKSWDNSWCLSGKRQRTRTRSMTLLLYCFSVMFHQQSGNAIRFCWESTLGLDFLILAISILLKWISALGCQATELASLCIREIGHSYESLLSTIPLSWQPLYFVRYVQGHLFRRLGSIVPVPIFLIIINGMLTNTQAEKNMPVALIDTSRGDDFEKQKIGRFEPCIMRAPELGARRKFGFCG